VGFPHSPPKVIGEPKFEDLKIILQLLYANVMSVSSFEGCGLYGHLGLIMTNAEYCAVATDVFLLPKTRDQRLQLWQG
jgi:hypothetical protein